MMKKRKIEKKLSLYPLSAEEALTALLQTPPPKRKPAKRKLRPAGKE
jgi:hypothetical protein